MYTILSYLLGEHQRMICDVRRIFIHNRDVSYRYQKLVLTLGGVKSQPLDD